MRSHRSHFNPRAPCGARLRSDSRLYEDRNFNPRAPCGARQIIYIKSISRIRFQPTRPLRGATRRNRSANRIRNISTHAPLAGRDKVTKFMVFLHQHFNPRAPCGARQALINGVRAEVIISTHAPLAGRDGVGVIDRVGDCISTHAPLAGRDTSRLSPSPKTRISTHAPLAGRDIWDKVYHGMGDTFQPTRPLRGATGAGRGRARVDADFNPRAPCGARRRRSPSAHAGRAISTHAPLAGRDSKSVQITMHIFAITDKFQMLLHRMPPVRAFCSFLMQENHADFGCEPPK